MKHIFPVLLFVLSINIKAQTTENENVIKRNNFFYVAPVELFFNTLQLGFEHKFKNHNTIALMGGFRLSKKDEKVNRLGGTGELQYRVNLFYNKETLSSFTRRFSTFAYFAPYLQYRYEEINDAYYLETIGTQNNITTVHSGFGGLGFGFRLTALENRFCMNFYAGGGLKYSDVAGNKKYADFWEVGYTGFAPKLAFQMGIAF